jgi:hypothetical protein
MSDLSHDKGYRKCLCEEIPGLGPATASDL